MGEIKKDTSDILGLAPYGEALNILVRKTFEGVEGFLKSVCTPALGEIGSMFHDKVRYWRLNNILRILEKAKGRLNFQDDQLQLKAHPRIALSIIENGSVIDDEEVQEMWAGLFASSCTQDGIDDQNLIFVDLLKQMTKAQAKILNYSCENARKIIHPNGLVTAESLQIDLDTLIRITSVADFHRLDRELDHMRSIELIGSSLGGGGFSTSDNLIAEVGPTALALNLYLKTHGINESPKIYWGKSAVTESQNDK